MRRRGFLAGLLALPAAAVAARLAPAAALAPAAPAVARGAPLVPLPDDHKITTYFSSAIDPPVQAVAGDLWIDMESGAMYRYDSTYWSRLGA